MRNFSAIILIAFALFSYRHKIFSFFKPKHVPVSLVTEGNCKGKELCGIVYVAPWCPACHSIEPLLKSAIVNTKNHVYGIQVIVGRGKTEEENNQKALELGEGVIVDNNGTYFKELNIAYFPTIMVVNQHKKVQKEGQDALQWVAELAAE